MFEAQSLPRLENSATATVEKAGFVRTLGGVDVYLALAARVADLSRSDVDQAVLSNELQVLPAMRGCIYLVPRSQAAWSLRLADLLSRRRRELEHAKAGIRQGELERVGQAILGALGEGPSTTASLRIALPDEAIRSLGDSGKKVGISSTLPPALRELEFRGEIERALEGGRLDSERYLWRIAKASPFAEVDIPEDPKEVFAHFAALYLRYSLIGSSGDFAAWCGLGKRDAATVFAALNQQPETATVPIEVAGFDRKAKGAELRTLARNVDALERSSRMQASGAALLPFEDNLMHLRGGPAPLVDPAHHQIPVPTWGQRGKKASLGDARHMSFRSIALDGQIVGFWEYDPDTSRAITACFAELSAKQHREIDRVARETATLVREELGHGKSFSLDTDADLKRRTAELRQVQTLSSR